MNTNYVISWKSKALDNSKFIALNSDFLPNIKCIFLKNRTTIQ